MAGAGWQPLDAHDLVANFGFLLVFGALGAWVLRQTGTPFFYQTQMPAAVMWACGHGFVSQLHLPETLSSFLFMKTASFDCGALAAIGETRGIGNLASIHPYLMASVALVWRWLGVSYWSLWPLFALFYGSYVAGCYTLGRLFLPRGLALALGLIIGLSPVALAYLPLLRDFAKGPFIVWAVVLALLATRALRPRRAVVLALMAGATVGVGVGFRSDVLLLFPLLLAVLAIGLDPRRLRRGQRIAALAAFLLGSAGFGLAPTLHSAGGNGFGALFMEGLSEPFRAFLGLDRAPYDFGWRYSDELTVSGIAGDLRRPDPAAYDAAQSRPMEGINLAARRSTSYVLGWLPIFGADVVTRALSSVVAISGFYALLAPERRALDPNAALYPGQTALANATARVVDLLAHRWLGVVGMLGLLALLWRIDARSPREALCVGLILAVLLTYPFFQFGLRHLFHLESVFWLAAFSLVLVPFEYAELRRRLPRLLLGLALVAATGAGLYALLIAHQDRDLKRRIDGLLAGPQHEIEPQASLLSTGRQLIEIPVPAMHADVVDGPVDAMNIDEIQTIAPYAVRSSLDRLAVDVGGPECGAGPLTIEFAYDKRPRVWQPLDRTFTLAEVGPEPTTVIFPAIYRATQNFKGLIVSRPGCAAHVRRLEASSRLPGILTVVLAPGWRHRPFHYALPGL